MSLPSNCLLCGEGREKQRVVTSHVFGIQKNKGHAFYHCLSCDIYYQYPKLNPDEEKIFYAAEFERFMEDRAGKTGGWQKAEEHVKANEETQKRRTNYLKSYLKKDQDILEIGCSSGFMLYPLMKAGHNCIGIEPSNVFSDFLRNNDLLVFHSVEEMLQKSPDKKFDLIMHYFVLEHISDPISFLEDQHNLLKPNGKIIFEIPNVADPLYSVYDLPAFERFYWSVAHSWYFSETSLNYLLSKLGYNYKILLDQRYDLSNHIVWARDGKPGGMGRFTDSLGIDIEDQYKQALIRIGKCDTLIGIIGNDDDE